MSITQAAEDLHRTQGAVSKQIAALEQQLGLKLFERGHRALAFTPEGRRLFRSADSAVQQLQDVLGELRPEDGPRPVVLSTSVGVAGVWLLPRLARFQARHPGLDLRISANNRVEDLKREGIDLAIRYAAEAPGGERLMGEAVLPVAHPSLAGRDLRDPAVLRSTALIEFDGPPQRWLRWSDWLGEVLPARTRPASRLRFNQYDQVIQAALAAQGVALGRLPLIQPLLDEGRLAPALPPAEARATTHALWLVLAEPAPPEAVRRVAAWIRSEAQAAG